MKAISIKQPWANLICSGRKTCEIRSWQTKHRGDILIVSSLLPDSWAMKDFNFSRKDLLFGKALCIAELYKIEKMERRHEQLALCDFSPDLFAWHLRNIRQIEPFPVKGKLSIYNVEY